MSEEEFETTEFKERLEQATEHGLEMAKHRDRWLTYLSLSTALIAVLAAIAALESGAYSNEALLQKNEALLARAEASDQWAFYQAKSIKGVIYSSQFAALKGFQSRSRGTCPEGSRPIRYEKNKEISNKARELESEEKKQNELSDVSMEHHHRFAYAVTMFQIGIALSAVAALSRQRIIWYGGIGIAVFGLVCFIGWFSAVLLSKQATT